jgi:hypothetical protein
MRLGTLVAACFALCTASASADQTPIPLQTPTGYRDYCDGAKKGEWFRCPNGGAPKRVWRQLSTLTVAPGAPCPVFKPRTIASAGPALGSRPVYLHFGTADRSTLRMPYPAPDTSPAAGTGWTLGKVSVLLAKRFHQPFVVRGRRIDGPGELGFSGGRGRRPFEAMQFPARGSTARVGSYRFWGLLVWATTPGCYALQVDGLSFSHVVVVRIDFAGVR